jgi:putative flippase GtrA
MNQFFKFAIIGTIGFAVDSAALYFFIYLINDNLYIGRLFSYLCAVTTTWYLNRKYTFESNNVKIYKEWTKFSIFNLSGGIINFGAYTTLVFYSSFFADMPIFAVAIGSILGMFANFTLSKLFVFTSNSA